MGKITVAEAAAEIGCSKSTITRHCAKWSIGEKLQNGMILLTKADVDRLRKLVQPTSGNPDFIARKKPEK